MQQLRLETLFTLVGDHLNDVLRAAANSGIRIVDMRHESAVTHAADAYARATREPAISLVTGGPGHTNSLTGIATAYLNLSPLIAVSGSRANSVADRGAFQDIDQIGMARPVVKWAAEPHSPGQIPFYLSRAYAEANSGRKGPAHLTIPVDLFSATAQTNSLTALAPSATGAQSDGEPDSDSIARAIDMMRSAQRPVVIAGSGIWWSHAEADLAHFIEHTRFPLYTATLAKGAVPDHHPLCFGYPDPTLNRATKKAFAEADLFVIVGKRIDYRLALGGPNLLSPDARVIQIDIHAPELGMNRKLDLAMCADARLALRKLIAAAGEKPWGELPWIEELKKYRAEWECDLARRAENAGAVPLHPAAFFFELRKHLPADAILSWDGGDFVQWGRAIIPATGPGRWLRLGPLGTIGAGFPNALALQIANPGRRVVMITGDGSLGFYIAEMDTAVRHKLPVVLIVGNDAGWGMERELQGGGSTIACELRETRYDKVMEGFGGAGETIDSAGQIAPALDRAFNSGMPYVINVRIKGVASPFTEWNLSSRR